VTARETEITRARLGQMLAGSRARTLQLTNAVDDEDLVKQHSPLMSPLIWGIGAYRTRRSCGWSADGGGREPVAVRYRPSLRRLQELPQGQALAALLSPAETRAYVGRSPGQGVDVLDTAPLSGDRRGPRASPSA